MSDPLTDRLPPQNRDAERGVLGGILRDPDTLPTVQQIIVADNFYFDAHQKIYTALCDLSNESQPLDLVLLYDKLRKNKQLEDVGGKEYLVELWEAVPTGANAEYHAKLVRDTAMVRGLIHASNEILRDAYDRTQSADETGKRVVVTVKPVRKLKTPVTLVAIKADKAFATWDLVRVARLSVMPVPEALWAKVEKMGNG